MQHSKKILAALIINFIAPTPQADARVDLQEGAYHWDHAELLIASPREKLSWSRSYNSRSEATGLLGLGWCTEFEWRLNPGPHPWIQKCDTPEVLAQNRVQETPQGYVVAIENENHALLFDLRGELEGFRPSAGRGAPRSPSEYIEVLPPPQDWVLQRDLRQRPTSLLTPQGTLITFHYAKDGRLEKISSPLSKWQFKYDRQLLSETRNQPGENEKYRYDDYMNLTRVTRADKTLIEARYDNRNDTVISTKENGCHYRYEYQTHHGAGFIDDQVLETCTCTEQSPRLTRNSFHYRTQNDHTVALEKRTSFLQGE